jgi:S1-C subfamily serine protease
VNIFLSHNDYDSLLQFSAAILPTIGKVFAATDKNEETWTVFLKKQGLVLTKIEENSPASRSQLQDGDIIISFNGKHIDNSQELLKS